MLKVRNVGEDVKIAKKIEFDNYFVNIYDDNDIIFSDYNAEHIICITKEKFVKIIKIIIKLRKEGKIK